MLSVIGTGSGGGGGTRAVTNLLGIGRRGRLGTRLINSLSILICRCHPSGCPCRKSAAASIRAPRSPALTPDRSHGRGRPTAATGRERRREIACGGAATIVHAPRGRWAAAVKSFIGLQDKNRTDHRIRALRDLDAFPGRNDMLLRHMPGRSTGVSLSKGELAMDHSRDDSGRRHDDKCR